MTSKKNPGRGSIGYAIIAVAGEKPPAVEMLMFPSREEAQEALWAIQANKRAPKILRETAVIVAWNRRG